VKWVSVFEHDLIMTEPKVGAADSSPCVVPQSVFEWLRTMALGLNMNASKQVVQFANWNRQEAVSVANYVGVLRSPCGFQIEILPKSGSKGGQSKEHSRRHLLKMLTAVDDLKHLEFPEATVESVNGTMFDLLLRKFLNAVEKLIAQGIRRGYSTQEDNISVLKGQLKIQEHLKQNSVRKDRFYACFDEFTPNRPENRILRKALTIVAQQSQSTAVSSVAERLLSSFSEATLIRDSKADLRKIRFERNLRHYDEAISLARLIISEDNPMTGFGKNRALSLMFPMEKLFEAFVLRTIRKAVADDIRIQYQASSLHFVQHQNESWFNLRPDILLNRLDKTVVVLDTKWKLLNSSDENENKNYGLSQSDFYQLYAYGQTYLKGNGVLMLVYPRTEKFKAPLSVFTFPHSPKLELWVVPFCIDQACLILPSANANNREMREAFRAM
jgi:5-methylcytosine-specific restriction enzyme subunit McrC